MKKQYGKELIGLDNITSAFTVENGSQLNVNGYEIKSFCTFPKHSYVQVSKEKTNMSLTCIYMLSVLRMYAGSKDIVDKLRQSTIEQDHGIGSREQRRLCNNLVKNKFLELSYRGKFGHIVYKLINEASIKNIHKSSYNIFTAKCLMNKSLTPKEKGFIILASKVFIRKVDSDISDYKYTNYSLCKISEELNLNRKSVSKYLSTIKYFSKNNNGNWEFDEYSLMYDENISLTNKIAEKESIIFELENKLIEKNN